MRSGVPVLFSRLLSVLLGFVTAPVIAHALGPSGRGETAAALAIISLLPIVVGLGIPLVVRRRSVELARMPGAIRAARVVAAAGVIPSALIGLPLSHFLLPHVGVEAVIAFVIACATVPLAVLWICDANALIAQRRTLAFAVVNAVPPVVSFAGAVTGLAAGALSVPFVMYVAAVSTLVTAILTAALVRVPLRGEVDSVRYLLSEGVSFSGSQIAEAASYRLDQAIALPILGASAAGFYSVAATIGLIPYALGQSIGAVSFASIAEPDLERSIRDARIGFTVRASVMLSSGLAIAVAAVSPLLIPLLFGPAFAPAIIPAVIATLGSIFVVLAYATGSALTALGRGWRLTIAQIVGLAVGIALLFILGPVWGAIGAAVASAIGYAGTAVLATSSLGLAGPYFSPRRRDMTDAMRLVLRGRTP